MSDEIVRRLRNRSKSSLNYLKESMPVEGLREEDEDDLPLDDEDEYTPEEEETDEEDSDLDIPEDETDDNEEDLNPDSMEDPSGEIEDKESANPLGNNYAINYEMGSEVVLAYSNGNKSKLTGIIDGYDSEGFYRVKWSNGLTTNGFTDISLTDLVKDADESTCVCGNSKFVNENHKLVCDTCGRIIKEFKDPLSIADRSRPKGKKLVRSEAHPISTSVKPNISDSIKRAFNRSNKLNEESEEDDLFAILKKEFSGEFWTRVHELEDDIESLGYDVLEMNGEYIVVADEDSEVRIPIGGTSRTMFLDFGRARK